MMPDIHYENRKLAGIYDLDSPWSADRDFYLGLTGAQPMRILDLGCGTGLLCDAYAARHHHVTGVDPSEAMLEVARRKPHGLEIEWVQCAAQDYHGGRPFDLIVMTGHAFQVLLEDADVLATFKTMRSHMESHSLAVFESRNPDIDWSKRWDYDLVLDRPEGAVLESRRFILREGERMTFELRYRFPDETLVSHSELRFLSRAGIEELLLASGLLVERVMGDWDGSRFDERQSPEMIFFVRAVS